MRISTGIESIVVRGEMTGTRHKSLAAQGRLSSPTIGVSSYIIQEEFDRYTGYWWRDDSNGFLQILYEEVDESQIEHIPIVDFTKPSTCDDFPCPLAGGTNAKVELKVVEFPASVGLLGSEDDETPQIKILRRSLSEQFPWAEYIVRCGWVANTDVVWAQLLDRSQMRLALVIFESECFVNSGADGESCVDESMGQAQVVLEETSSVWINVSNILEFFQLIDRTIKFVWASESSGFRHLEFVTCQLGESGSSERQTLTSGEWAVDDAPVIISSSQDEIFFTGRRETPMEAHLYRLEVSGLQEWIRRSSLSGDIRVGKPVRLTKLGMFHEVVVSHNGDIMVDTYSSVANPPVCEVSFGRAGAEIELFRHPHVPDYVVPELVAFKSPSHGHTVYGRIYRAKCAKNETSVPAPTLVHVYGGPCVQFVLNKYMGGNLKASLWAQVGYNVVSFDNCGSACRGVAFEGMLKNALGELEVQDQVDGLKFLAQNARYSVSLDRVAVYGHSYGGYMALMSLARRPDIFKIALSGAPVTFWEAYDTGYTERYLGLPQSRPEAYRKSSVLEMAHRFPEEPGRLWLFHGLQDENVHFHNTAMLIDVMIRECKPYNLQVFPRDRHGIRNKASSIHYITSVTNVLLNNLPPS